MAHIIVMKIRNGLKKLIQRVGCDNFELYRGTYL